MLRAMSWLPEAGPGRDDFERTFALRPELFAAFRDFVIESMSPPPWDACAKAEARRAGRANGAAGR